MPQLQLCHMVARRYCVLDRGQSSSFMAKCGFLAKIQRGIGIGRIQHQKTCLMPKEGGTAKSSQKLLPFQLLWLTLRERLPSACPASKSKFRLSIPMLYPEVGMPFSQLQKHKAFMHDWKKWLRGSAMTTLSSLISC